MNRKIILGALAIGFAMMIGMNACKKDDSNYTSTNSPNSDVVAMTSEADAEFRSANFEGGDESAAYSINDNGLPEEYTLTAEDMSDDSKRHSNKKHPNCLKKLNLSDTQKINIVIALNQYDSCRMADLNDYYDSLKTLIIKTELKRQQLVVDYRLGNITRSQFQVGLKDLRAEFRAGLILIKLDHADHLKDCYQAYLMNLQNILTPTQWIQLMKCRK